MWRELPPTAGLPLAWSDLLALAQELDFAKALCDFLSVPAVQIESSGSACLVVALETLKKMSARRNVIVPGYTCPLVPIAVAQAGLNLVVCDTAHNSFNFAPENLKQLCDDQTLCIVPTHMGGLVAYLEPALALARATGAYVIEDAAQVLGARMGERAAGTAADIGFYSLSVGKGLSTFGGGILVAADATMRDALAQTGRRLARANSAYELKHLALLAGYFLFYNPLGLTAAYGADLRHWLKKGNLVRAVQEEFPLQIPLHEVGTWRRRIGASALRRLPAMIAANAQQGRERAKQLSALPGLTVLQEFPGTAGTWPFLMVLFEREENRDRALEQLWQAGLGVTRLFIHDLCGYEYLRPVVPRSSLANASSFAARMLTISNTPWSSAHDFERIIHVLNQSARPLPL
ncbi:MAG: DegT/DnrJ/EryC1/StrS family aminotransferase [Terriglobales bacterium]